MEPVFIKCVVNKREWSLGVRSICQYNFGNIGILKELRVANDRIIAQIDVNQHYVAI